ncbi:MAG: 5-(carboxyamino)imidazole ribonucleotide synthase [Alphaproteobacteria bacterium]
MANPTSSPLPPGAVIGILGGGQLGRMTAMAAASLGFRSHVFCPDADAPATHVTSRATIAPYEDEAALAAFAAAVDVVTIEFENIPLATAEFLAARVPFHPDPAVLAICQNRLKEKDFCGKNGVPTTRYASITDAAGLGAAVTELGLPCVLKTAEMGYDGKGQIAIAADTDLAATWTEMARAVTGAGAILERYVDFRLEISVIVARGIDGARQTYVPVENQHKNHILDQTIVPARAPAKAIDKAEGIARHLAAEIGLVGLLAIEMFVTGDGAVLVNELAPRPHNSGHWTLDACVTSQFEQLVRAVAGLPLGSTEALADAVMKNLIGEDVEDTQSHLSDPRTKLHLYGKTETRSGRKMGHITRIVPKY